MVKNDSRSLLVLDAKAFSREFPLLSFRGTWLNKPLVMAAHDIVLSHCDRVGLKMDFDDPEYPVWVVLRNRGFAGRIDDFAVDNDSGRIVRATQHPCAVLATSRTLPAGMTNWFPFQSQYGLI